MRTAADTAPRRLSAAGGQARDGELAGGTTDRGAADRGSPAARRAGRTRGASLRRSGRPSRSRAAGRAPAGDRAGPRKASARGLSPRRKKGARSKSPRSKADSTLVCPGGRATFNVREVAALLGVGRDAIYEAANRGEIPGAIRIGRRRVFARATVLAWLGNPAPSEK